MGPVYLVIFCYWVGPVPYLELFGAGPVEKNTLYKIQHIIFSNHYYLDLGWDGTDSFNRKICSNVKSLTQVLLTGNVWFGHVPPDNEKLHKKR